MARALSTHLTNEMASLNRSHAAALTVESFWPSWTAKISGLSGNAYEQYAHGHAVTSLDVGSSSVINAGGFFQFFPFRLRHGNQTGVAETIIFRARSGSYADPQSGALYISIITGSDLDDPTTWESLWTSTGVTGLMYPAWTADSGASHGGSIDVVAWDNAGTNTGRVFYITSGGNLRYRDYNLDTGALIGSTVTIASLGTGRQLSSMQLAACSYDEVFVLKTEQVEASQAAWQKDLYGTNLVRYSYDGTWSEDTDNPWPYHSCMDGHAVKDSIDEDATTSDTTDQWNKRPCGGLAAFEIDTNTVLVSFGAIHWRRHGYWTNNAAMRSWLYHRDSGWWQEGPEIDRADFVNGQRLKLPMFAKASTVGGEHVLTWSRLVEPADFEQDNDNLNLTRMREVVFAKVSDDGQRLTHWTRLGDQDNLTGAGLIQVTRSGTTKLYAIGWRSVYESPQCAALGGAVDSPTDLAAYATGFTTTQNNRMGMGVDVPLQEPSLVHSGALAEGMLIRAKLGTPTETIQIAQAYIDQIQPSLEIGRESATLNARADQLLQNVKAEGIGDKLSQGTVYIAPSDPIKHVNPVGGVWTIEKMGWPGEFFSGEFSDLDNDLCYRLKSYPFARTGAEILTQYQGGWFSDVAMLGLDPRVDGAIEASVRFGDNYDRADFTTSGGVSAVIAHSNGIITSITWGGSNTVAQYACMAGLVCHVASMKRKYMFLWENNSDFSTASHLNDTYTSETFDKVDYSAHGTGANRLYLVITDEDDSGNYVNKSIQYCAATGLTAGKPADMRMQVVGGTLYCFYRYHSTGTPNQWRLAFEHQSGRFGASSFGLIGRGQGGLMWDMFKADEAKIAQTINYVDFWNIKGSDGVMDNPMSAHLARYCWQGWTATEFETKESDSSRLVDISAQAYYLYTSQIVNPTIDFKVDITNSNEAGVFVRGVDNGSPTDDCIKIGLVASNTANSSTSEVNYYIVKRRYASGAEVTSAREYSPMPLQIKPGYPIPVRVTVRGSIYSVWIAGIYAGHFRDTTSLGSYFGLYASGDDATFSEIEVPELYEIPIYAGLKPGQTMAAAIRAVLAGRRIKAIISHDGVIKFSYFETHGAGPSLQDTLTRSAYRTSDRAPGVVRVEGAYTFAEYTSEEMLTDGRRFETIHNPDLFHWEHAHQEARMIMQELAEREQELTLTGPPDLRAQPEDQSAIIVAGQSINGNYLIDDIKISYDLKAKECSMVLGVRAVVVL